MNEPEVIMGVYDEQGNLIGYKADSFWSLTRHREYAKPDRLQDGNIKPHLLSNLVHVLRRDKFKTVIDVCAEATRQIYYGNFETYLLGFERESEPPTFTHRIFADDVQPLTDEDRERACMKSKQDCLQVDQVTR